MWRPDSWPTALNRTVRLAVGIIGGFLTSQSLIALSGVFLSRLGLPPGDAASIALIFGIVLFVGLAVWIASTRRLLMVTASMMIGTAIASYAAPALALT
ncbi:MAG: hypothetical protein AAF225_05480 [Pseudomonadota bacterium]